MSKISFHSNYIELDVKACTSPSINQMVKNMSICNEVYPVF